MKILLALIAILTLSSCGNSYDKDVWLKNANDKSDNPRFEMIDNLREDYLVKGISSSEVNGLLGIAEEIDTTKFGIHWSYSIGSNPGMHIDPYFLMVDFDSTGHLIETRIIEH